MKTTPHPIQYVNAQCRSAGMVWIALCDYANARQTARIRPKLSELSEATGIPKRTVSRALWVLEQARWIRLRYTATYQGGKRRTPMRIRLRRMWRLWRKEK